MLTGEDKLIWQRLQLLMQQISYKLNSYFNYLNKNNLFVATIRDEANYRQQYENEQQRKTTLYATALANEAEDSTRNISNTFGMIGNLFTTAAAAIATDQQTPTG